MAISRLTTLGVYYNDSTATLVSHVHDDLAYGNDIGFELRGSGEFFNLNAHDNIGTNGIGISAPAGAVLGIVHDVTSWRNNTGIDWRGGVLQNARIYGNFGPGLDLSSSGWNVSGIVAYDNFTGVQSSASSGDNSISNSLIYDNRDQGVLLSSVQTSKRTFSFTNNTVRELSADAFKVIGTSKSNTLLH